MTESSNKRNLSTVLGMRDLGESARGPGSGEGAGAEGAGAAGPFRLRAGGSARPSCTYRVFGAGIPEPEHV